ncbi:MAG: HAD-IA family hydrolase [Mycobacterium sp.]|nr:HAD-IA family hydrolase [Mycobacterium sp.]
MTPNHIPGGEDQHGASGARLPKGLRALVFDVGETLVDESRMWTAYAQHAGVTPFTLMGVIGALIERGEDHRSAWPILGVDPPSTRPDITNADLYPDALDCLRAARTAGFIVGIAGNQPHGVANRLETLGVGSDFVASSADWGVAKPSPQFFEKVISAAQLSPHEIMYVGDRLDNDILPAHGANLRTALVRRGPWGYLHANRPESKVADLQLDSLNELTAAITGDALDLYTADNFTTVSNASLSRPGWADEAIAVVDADPEWQSQGQRLRDTLQALLAPWLTARIEHVGSTAVPGLPAKPIIDLQAAVAELAEADSMAAVLGPHDWHHVAPHLDQRPWRRLFVKVAGGRRIAHLHIMTAGTPRWHQQIAFRDALRADSALAADYAALKRALAQRHSDDRESYSAAKESLIQAVLNPEID